MDDAPKENENDDEVIVAILLDEDEDNVIDIREPERVVVPFEHKSQEQQSNSSPEKDDVVVDTFIKRRQLAFKNRTVSRKQVILTTIASVVIVLMAAGFAIESPIFDVDNVELQNTSTMPFTKEEKVQLEKISNELKTQPLYRVRTNPVVNDLQKLLFVQSVKTSKSWPSTVTIALERRRPIAIVETDKGFVLVDTNSVVFEKTPSPPKNLPVLEGMEEITMGSPLENEAFMEIISAAPNEIKNQITRIIKNKNVYDVVLSDGINIKIGEPRDLRNKLAIAWSIILAKPRNELGYIDVSVPSLPVSGSPDLKL